VVARPRHGHLPLVYDRWPHVRQGSFWARQETQHHPGIVLGLVIGLEPILMMMLIFLPQLVLSEFESIS
jgi:hypothetical protein